MDRLSEVLTDYAGRDELQGDPWWTQLRGMLPVLQEVARLREDRDEWMQEQQTLRRQLSDAHTAAGKVPGA